MACSTGRCPDLRGGHQEVVEGCRREDVRALRRLVDRCGVSAGLEEEDRDVAVLLVSELLTNAVLHGGPPARLAVRVGHEHLHVEVADDGPVLPTVRRPDDERPSGRGMALVDTLASAWGVDAGRGSTGTGGKTVWFDVARAAPSPHGGCPAGVR